MVVEYETYEYMFKYGFVCMKYLYIQELRANDKLFEIGNRLTKNV